MTGSKKKSLTVQDSNRRPSLYGCIAIGLQAIWLDEEQRIAPASERNIPRSNPRRSKCSTVYAVWY